MTPDDIFCPTRRWWGRFLCGSNRDLLGASPASPVSRATGLYLPRLGRGRRNPRTAVSAHAGCDPMAQTIDEGASATHIARRPGPPCQGAAHRKSESLPRPHQFDWVEPSHATPTAQRCRRFIPEADIGYSTLGRIEIVGDYVWNVRHRVASRPGSPLSASVATTEDAGLVLHSLTRSDKIDCAVGRTRSTAPAQCAIAAMRR